MSGLSLKVTVDDTQVRAALSSLDAQLDDMTAIFDEVGDMLVLSTLERFERGEDPGGAPWTVSQRAERTGGKTLVDSGRLQDSIVHEAGPKHVAIGTNVIYAAIHQFGGQAGRGLAATIPARPYLGVSAEDEAEINRIFSARIGEALQ